MDKTKKSTSDNVAHEVLDTIAVTAGMVLLGVITLRLAVIIFG